VTTFIPPLQACDPAAAQRSTASSSVALASTQVVSVRLLDLFPEWRAGFQIIHQKFGRRERRLAMRRGGRTIMMSSPGTMRAVAVNDGGTPMSGQRPTASVT